MNLDVPNIEITISPDNQSHDQTPPAASSHSFSPQSQQRTDSSRLFWLALTDDWRSAQFIVRNNPDVVCDLLTEKGDTVLHVAADAGSIHFVEELVELLVNFNRTQDLLISNSEGMLPVHLAVLTGNETVVLYLCLDEVLDIMDYENIEKLFFMSISNNMFDVTKKIHDKHLRTLVVARYQEGEERLTALHMLARKPSEILKKNSEKGLTLLRMIWYEVTELSTEKILELFTKPSSVLFDAIKSGHNMEWFFEKYLKSFVDLNKGQNLWHFLIQHRRLDYFMFVKKIENEHTLRKVDQNGNNILHMAAHLPLQLQVLSGLIAITQMQEELEWFKKVEKMVPKELRSVKNNKGKRPIDVFYDEHKKLSDEIKESAKGIANSGMIVATLVATVVFAAALTVPGDKKNDWFVVFIITNAIALFSSSASILSFLSNFTSSRFAESEFVISLHPSLTFGPALLIISVAAMVVAFIAASFLIFEDTSKWVSYVVASMGVFPLLLFPLFQFSFFDDLIWSRWYRPKLESMVPVSTTLYDMFVKQPLKFVRFKSSDSTPFDSFRSEY